MIIFKRNLMEMHYMFVNWLNKIAIQDELYSWHETKDQMEVSNKYVNIKLKYFIGASL